MDSPFVFYALIVAKTRLRNKNLRLAFPQPPVATGSYRHSRLICYACSCIFDPIMIEYDQLNKLEFVEGKVMTLKDISNGPDWIMWAVFVIFALMSIVLLTGRGAGLIAGYNTASKAEKSKYDKKKLCRVTGAGLSVITVLVLGMAIWEEILPAVFAYIFLAITLIDCVVMIILMNTVCKR